MLSLHQCSCDRSPKERTRRTRTRPNEMHERERNGRNETHGTEMNVYSMPMRIPISRMSDICATHGVTTEVNAPDKRPYRAAKMMIATRLLPNIQKTRHESPAKKAEGQRRLNRPILSDNQAGATRPKTPPAFMTDRTQNAALDDMFRVSV